MEEEEEEEEKMKWIIQRKKKKTLYVPMAIPYTYSHASEKHMGHIHENQSEKSRTHGHLSKLIKYSVN